ncbi:MAG: hypothetical protein ACR2FY_10050 [Pirellulaceae bacterium]
MAIPPFRLPLRSADPAWHPHFRGRRRPGGDQYVQLSLEMSQEMRLHFRLACLAVVVVAIVLTLLMALWETRHLRPVPQATLRGQAVDRLPGQL